MSRGLLSLLFIVCSGKLLADEWRQDFGVYQSRRIWIGDELKDYADLDSTTNSGTVTTLYSSFSYSFALEEGASLVTSIRATESTMNGFSAGGATAGEVQSGISELSAQYIAPLFSEKEESLVWSFLFAAPANTNRNSNTFIAISDGQTKYKLGLEWNTSFADSGVVIGVGYLYRPGAVLIINNDRGEDNGNSVNNITKNRINVPDKVLIDITVPKYLGSKVFALSLNHEQAISGNDIGSVEFEVGSGVGRPPFPTNREVRTFARVFAGTPIGDSNWLDLSLSTQIHGRNTDQGVGFNISYTKVIE